jgi:predicted HTH transcriptional regulator
MNLTELLRRPEGKTLEFKRDVSSATGVLRTVVAFANTAGGTILIGVEDGTRHVRGIADPLSMEERLASLLSDGIAPRLVPDIEVLPWRSTNVLAVQVYPSPSRPHCVKAEGTEAGVFVRVGSTNRRADEEMVAELRRASLGRSFDEQAIAELDSEALDFRVASECFAPVRKLRKTDLETLRLLVQHQGRKVPSVGGVLLFGRDADVRQAHFPDAWIQAGRFAGSDKTRIVDSMAFRGALPLIVQSAIEFVQKHGLHGYDIGALRRAETWSLPPVALREAIVNAVVHADYAQRGAPIRVAIFDDRVEIENAGLLPPGLTVEDLRRGVSKLRNRVIGRVFQELGLIEQWGSGIQRMSAACRDAGLPIPLLEEIGIRFRVTLHTTRGQVPPLDDIDQGILDALSAGAGLSTHEIATRIERTPRAARTRLASLVERGLVREIGSSPHDPKRRYFSAAQE